MKRIAVFALYISWLILLMIMPLLVKAADIGLSLKVEKVNEPSTYYTWVTLKDLPDQAKIVVLRDGQTVSATFTPYTDKTTGAKMLLGSDTYPPAGDHTYQVTVYNSSGAKLGEASSKVTVPSGSYVPPSAPPATTMPGTPDYTDIELPHTRFASLQALITAVIEWLLAGAGVTSVIALVIGGIMYISAGGDQSKAEGAKKTITYAVLGLVIIILALVIVAELSRVLGG